MLKKEEDAYHSIRNYHSKSLIRCANNTISTLFFFQNIVFHKKFRNRFQIWIPQLTLYFNTQITEYMIHSPSMEFVINSLTILSLIVFKIFEELIQNRVLISLSGISNMTECKKPLKKEMNWWWFLIMICLQRMF